MVGESEYNESLVQEYTYNSGIFLLSDPISCDGTLVAVNASGLCPLADDNMDRQMELRLLVFQRNGTEYTRNYSAPVTADCNNASGSNYTNGSVRAENLKVPISCGDFLAIRFRSTCSNNRCLFKPTIVNITGKQLMYFTVPSGRVDTLHMDDTQMIADASLLFSANIVNITGKDDIQVATPQYIVIYAHCLLHAQLICLHIVDC